MNDRRKDPGATPRLGTLDGLDLDGSTRAAPPPAAPPPRRRFRWILWMGLLLPVAVALAVLALWRDTISQRLVPDSALNLQIEQAQLSLARGDVVAAREGFQAVLAQDPDYPAARSGLSAVREAALLQAREAIAAGDAGRARDRIALARTMAAPASALDALTAELQAMESTGADIARMLEEARAAQAAGLLEQVPGGALALYSQVLQLQPDNAIALDGRRDILAGMLRQADALLASGQVEDAAAVVARVVQADPSHLDLPAMKARLGEAQSRREQARETALRQAAANLHGGRLEQAAEAYLALLAAEPDAVEPRQGLDDTAAAMAARATRQAADFDFVAAEESLQRAREWAPESREVAAAGQRLQEARDAQAQLSDSAAADRARLPQLLAQARAAMRRGELIDPPGDSAWDRLRVASAIAPDDPDLRDALKEYDRRARACFEDELAGNRLSKAQACLDARAVRDRGGDRLVLDRRRLADRWLAFADERLGAGEFALARRAYDAAQALDPANPGLGVMAERLRRATGD